MTTSRHHAIGRWCSAIVALVLLLASPTLVSATVEKLTFAHLVEKADQIVIADVVGLTSHWDDTATLIVTDVTLSIRQTLKGKPVEQKPVLQIPGGQIEDLRLDVSDTPSFEIGQAVIVFLQDQTLQVVGGDQGKFTIVDEVVREVNIPIGQFSARIQEIMTAQQVGQSVDFDWADAPQDAPQGPQAAPQITALSPASGPARGASGNCPSDATVVTISGSNFGGSQGTGVVRFRRNSSTTYNACISSWSNTQIVARVPGGVSSGLVNVITSGGTSNGVSFVVTYSYGGAKWSTNTAGYKVNPNTNDVTGEENAVRAAATTWNNVGANFAFRYDGTTTKTGAARDNENVISWGHTGGSIATNYSWSSGTQLLEFDIVFEDNYSWATNGNSSSMDVQHIATHELGHGLTLLDLYGSADTAKTMYGFTSVGQTQQRTLESDDIAGLWYIYPCSLPANGVVLYEHANYLGRCLALTGSDATLVDNQFNDMASSIRFLGSYASGWQVVAYEHANYSGAASVFQGNDADFGNDTIGHDRTTSIRFRQACPAINAWKGVYWDNRTLSGEWALCRNDGSVDFNWWLGGPGSGIPSDNFSARWERTWWFNAGVYRFHLAGDDGVRLWVDGGLKIDQWRDQGYTDYTVDLTLSTGNHALKVEYYENGGGAAVKLWWETFGYNRIVSRNSNKCVDVNGGSTSNGASIVQWDCWGGANQAWSFVPVGSGYYKIIAKHSGKCLDVSGGSTSNGARLTQWDCHGGNNQLFRRDWMVVGYRLVNKNSNKCVDVNGWSTANGAVIQQWDCHNGNNQLWSFPATQQAESVDESGLSASNYVLPTQPPNATALIEYSLQAGETLDMVAALYNTTAEDILAANPSLMSREAVTVGTQFFVPASVSTYQPKSELSSIYLPVIVTGP